MSSAQIVAAAVVTLLCGFSGDVALAADVACGSYRQLCLGLNVDFCDATRLLPHELVFRVRSVFPTVKAEDIQLKLLDGNEAYTLSVSSDGAFAIPVSKALFDADAKIVSNQRKGTLEIHGFPLTDTENFRVPVAAYLDDNRIDYETLCKLSIERRQRVLQELAERAKVENNSTKVGEGDGQWYIVLRASLNGGTAKAVIVDKSEAAAELLRSQAGGSHGPNNPLQKVGELTYRIPYSEPLRELNPIISLSPDSSWSCHVVVLREDRD